MRIESEVLDSIHLDSGFALLSVQNIMTCVEYFKLMDIHLNGTINDCLFWTFMRGVTSLTRPECDKLFRLLDLDLSGELEFEEFYFLFCAMIASKDRFEKEFIHRHSDNIFKLFDSDGSGIITRDEFTRLGLLFNFDSGTIGKIFKEFEITGNRQLDIGEFRLFALACVDEQREKQAYVRVDAIQRNEIQFIKSMRPVLIDAIKTNKLPTPDKVAFPLEDFERPHLKVDKPWYEHLKPRRFIFRRPHLRRILERTADKIRFGLDTVFYYVCRAWARVRKWCRRRTETKATKERRVNMKPSRYNKSDYRNYNRLRRRGEYEQYGGADASEGPAAAAATDRAPTHSIMAARRRWKAKVAPAVASARKANAEQTTTADSDSSENK